MRSELIQALSGVILNYCKLHFLRASLNVCSLVRKQPSNEDAPIDVILYHILVYVMAVIGYKLIILVCWCLGPTVCIKKKSL